MWFLLLKLGGIDTACAVDWALNWHLTWHVFILREWAHIQVLSLIESFALNLRRSDAFGEND